MLDWLPSSSSMGLIQMLGKVEALSMQWSSPEPLPGMTHEEMAQHSLDFWLQSEDLPDPNNRITLNASDQILFHYEANNLEAHEKLVVKLKNLLNDIGCHEHLMPVEHYC